MVVNFNEIVYVMRFRDALKFELILSDVFFFFCLSAIKLLWKRAVIRVQ